MIFYECSLIDIKSKDTLKSYFKPLILNGLNVIFFNNKTLFCVILSLEVCGTSVSLDFGGGRLEVWVWSFYFTRYLWVTFENCNRIASDRISFTARWNDNNKVSHWVRVKSNSSLIVPTLWTQPLWYAITYMS